MKREQQPGRATVTFRHSILSESDLTTKIILTLLGTGIVLSTVATILGFMFDIPLILNIPNILMVITCTVLPTLFRKNLMVPVIVILYITAYLYLPFIFLTNNGLYGSGPYYFFMVFLYISFFFKGRKLIYNLIAVLLYDVFIITYGQFHPEIIYPYPDEISQFIDMLIGFISVAVVLVIITATTYREYSREQDVVIDTAEHLREKNEQLEQTLITDQLTNTYSRQYFFKVFEREYNRTALTRHPVSVLMIDVDHFKSVNDTFGHLVGDDVLKQIAKSIQSTVGEDGLVARYGGEEFIALVSTDSGREGDIVAEHIREEIEKLTFQTSHPLTVSIGVSGKEKVSEMMELIDLADRRLYEAKRLGRNRVVSS